MRILYFADIRFPLERANGIQTMETCHALAVRGHDLRLIVRPDTHTPPRDPYKYYGLPRDGRLAIELAPVMGPRLARRAAYLSFALGRAMGASRADVLLTRDLGMAHLLTRIPRAMRAPVVYESHGYAPDVATALPGLLSTARPASPRKRQRLASREAAVWRGADGYIAITAGLAKTFEEKFGSRPRLAVIPDGVRASGRPWSPPPATDPPVIGYAGHLYAWKGVDILLDALTRTPQVSALIVGGHTEDGDRRRLETWAAGLKITGRVTFAGHVTPPEVPALLERATVLALPNPPSAISTHFTSPLKLFEYMAAGRPIVASDLPAIREVLRHEENALLVRAGDAAALAAAIQRLIADRDLAMRLARKAFDDAAAYTWQRRAERLERFLDEVRASR